MSYGGLPGYDPPQPPAQGPPPYGAPPPNPIAPSEWTPGEAFAQAWARLKQDAGGVLLPLGIAIVLEAIPGLIGQIVAPNKSGDPMQMFQPETVRTTLVINLASIVVRSLFDGGVNRFCLNVIRGRPYGLSDVFAGMRLFPAFLAMNLIWSFAVGFGVVLFVVPGVILALGWALAEPALVDRDLSPLAALGWSWERTKGSRGKLLVFFLMMIAALLLGACAFGVGVFVAIPIVWIARSWIYVQVAGG